MKHGTEWLLIFVLAQVLIVPVGEAADLVVLPDDTVFLNLTAISDDGSTIVGTLVKEAGRYAAYWSETDGVVRIGEGYAHNCSADGSTIVGNMSGAGFEDLWGSETPLPSPPVSDLTYSGAYDISPDGSVVVGNYEYRFGPDRIVCAYRWTSIDGYQSLVCVTNGGWCNATGVDSTGDIICGFKEDTAFRWTADAGAQELPGLGSQMIPYYMSADGQHIIGSFGENGNGVFRWNAGTGVEVLVEDHANAHQASLSLSPDGRIATGLGAQGWAGALVWDENNIARTAYDVLVHEHHLPVGDWTNLVVQGTSADRMTIFGYGHDPTGIPHTWVARLNHPLGATKVQIGSHPDIEISWLGAVDETYTVERRGSDEADWSGLMTVSGTEGVITVDIGDQGLEKGHHYRVLKVPLR